MSRLEHSLAFQLGVLRIRGWEREYRFHPERRWRADFAFPDASLLVEVEGGLYSGGRHVRGKGYEADLLKYNAAVTAGWVVLRFGPTHIKDGTAVDAIAEYLKQRKGEDDEA